MSKEIISRIKHKYDSEANWIANNPILLKGESAVVDIGDNNVRFKIGNGVDAFVDLPYTDENLKNEINKITYKILVVTQSEYDALDTKDSNTLYVIEV